MTTPQLKTRIERLEHQQNPPRPRSYVIEMRDGESEMDLAGRVAAAGRPVVVMPKRCDTAEEWLARCGRSKDDQ